MSLRASPASFLLGGALEGLRPSLPLSLLPEAGRRARPIGVIGAEELVGCEMGLRLSCLFLGLFSVCLPKLDVLLIQVSRYLIMFIEIPWCGFHPRIIIPAGKGFSCHSY